MFISYGGSLNFSKWGFHLLKFQMLKPLLAYPPSELNILFFLTKIYNAQSHEYDLVSGLIEVDLGGHGSRKSLIQQILK